MFRSRDALFTNMTDQAEYFLKISLFIYTLRMQIRRWFNKTTNVGESCRVDVDVMTERVYIAAWQSDAQEWHTITSQLIGL